MNALTSEQVASDDLERDLKRTLARRDRALRQLAELDQTDTALDVMRNERRRKHLETRVSLGEQFYMRAKVPLKIDEEQLVVLDVGRGVFVEVNLDQAMQQVQARREWLHANLGREQAHISSIKTKAKQMVREQQQKPQQQQQQQQY